MLEYEEAFKQELARTKDRLLAGYAIDKALAKVAVTDEELKKYYNDNQDKMMSPEAVSASHILVKEEQEALDLLQKIEAGELSFEAAAKEHSTCPSGQNGGNLGEFGRGQMVPEFDEACFSMTVGEMRGPVKTQFGYHIIRLNGKKEATVFPFDEVKEELYQRLLAEKQQAAYRSRVNQLKILYPVEKY
ncbi:MAG: peptidyl-prolyl cis-trans isomerase [Clostridia bacterium]|nr:peptidyl-prolyl cis-trans isomerase [Clostridia bacterium]